MNYHKQKEVKRVLEAQEIEKLLEKEYINCGDLKESIDFLEDNKTNTKQWEIAINKLMSMYNKMTGERVYKTKNL